MGGSVARRVCGVMDGEDGGIDIIGLNDEGLRDCIVGGVRWVVVVVCTISMDKEDGGVVTRKQVGHH